MALTKRAFGGGSRTGPAPVVRTRPRDSDLDLPGRVYGTQARSQGRRDTFDVASEPLLALMPDVLAGPLRESIDEPLTLVEDRRQFFPEVSKLSTRPDRRLSGARARLRAKPSQLGEVYSPSVVVGFEYPRKVLVCIRRQRRKEVLHAKRFYGKNRHRLRYPRRNALSNISCRSR